MAESLNAIEKRAFEEKEKVIKKRREKRYLTTRLGIIDFERFKVKEEGRYFFLLNERIGINSY